MGQHRFFARVRILELAKTGQHREIATIFLTKALTKGYDTGWSITS
jgi:hypothetical protein